MENLPTEIDPERVKYINLETGEEVDFEISFRQCFESFQSLSNEERSAKMRRIIRSLNQKEIECVPKLAEIIINELPQTDRAASLRRSLSSTFDRVDNTQLLPLPCPSSSLTSSTDRTLNHGSYRDFLRSSLTELCNRLPATPEKQLSPESYATFLRSSLSELCTSMDGVSEDQGLSNGSMHSSSVGD